MAEEQNRSRKRRTLGILAGYGFMLLLLAADQWTKHLAATHLTNMTGDRWALSSVRLTVPFIPHVLSFRYVQNDGVAFSLFSGNVSVILIANIILLALLLFGHFRLEAVGAKKRLPLEIVLLAVCAGAVGNILDRLRLGYVIDFLQFEFIDFPVFNVADIYVTCGVACLFFLVLFYYKKDDDLAQLFGLKKKGPENAAA